MAGQCQQLAGRTRLPLRDGLGKERDAWHDDVDLANIANFPGRDIPEDRLVMTTSHGREPLTKTFLFSADVARHPAVDLPHTLILHVAAKDRENKVLRALAKVLDRSREKKAS